MPGYELNASRVLGVIRITQGWYKTRLFVGACVLGFEGLHQV